jgi:hypothetical protein
MIDTVQLIVASLIIIVLLVCFYAAIYSNTKSIWKTLAYGTLGIVAIPVGVALLIYIWMYGCNCFNLLLEGEANWYQGIVGVLFIIMIVIVAIASYLYLDKIPNNPNYIPGGFTSYRGPRGGEYRMSPSGKTKIYITRR